MTTITQVVSAITPSDPRTMTRDAFSAAAPQTIVDIVDMVTEVNTWATQANAMAAGLNAIATGAALAIPLTFSTTTTDSDPGNGILRLDNATQNAATTIRTDLIGNDGSTWTDVIALFDDSTSTIKGFITLVDTADATKWLVFSVTSLATPAGYVNITVVNVASSTANPFANGASLALQFTRNGDKGDTGAAGADGTGITPQATGFTATGGTTPKTLTVDEDITASNVARKNVQQEFVKPQRPSLQAETAPTANAITWDLTDDTVFQLNLNANVTTFNLTGTLANLLGYQYQLIVRYNGGTSIAFNAAFKFPNATSPTLTTTSGKIDIFNFVVASTDGGTTCYLMNTGSSQNLGA